MDFVPRSVGTGSGTADGGKVEPNCCRCRTKSSGGRRLRSFSVAFFVATRGAFATASSVTPFVGCFAVDDSGQNQNGDDDDDECDDILHGDCKMDRSKTDCLFGRPEMMPTKHKQSNKVRRRGPTSSRLHGEWL